MSPKARWSTTSSRASGATPASRSTSTTPSTTSCARTGRTASDRPGDAHPAAALRRRARLVHGAHALVAPAEDRAAVECRVLAQGSDPGAALPRARSGRSLRLPPGHGARRRARPRERRGVQRGHRRRKSRGDLRPRLAGARLRGPDGLHLSLSRDRGIRRRLALRAGSLDRKSTRLNSSHVRISYAVFCLKKKTTPGAVARCRLVVKGTTMTVWIALLFNSSA